MKIHELKAELAKAEQLLADNFIHIQDFKERYGENVHKALSKKIADLEDEINDAYDDGECYHDLDEELSRLEAERQEYCQLQNARQSFEMKIDSLKAQIQDAIEALNKNQLKLNL